MLKIEIEIATGNSGPSQEFVIDLAIDMTCWPTSNIKK